MLMQSTPNREPRNGAGILADKPAAQQPVYPDNASLSGVEATLAAPAPGLELGSGKFEAAVGRGRSRRAFLAPGRRLFGEFS